MRENRLPGTRLVTGIDKLRLLKRGVVSENVLWSDVAASLKTANNALYLGINAPAIGLSYQYIDWNADSGGASIKNKPITLGLVLGETSLTAYSGDKGKIAYDHSQLITGNPHAVTKANVGLGSCDNTSDANKPVSTSAQTALDLKTNLTIGQPAYDHSLVVTGNPHHVNKTDIGLGNCDNTSDVNKPISSATTSALGDKADLVAGKVPASQLPTTSYTILEYANFAAFPSIGSANVYYKALDTGLIYLWGGTTYSSVSGALALGETNLTAYRGDKGKTAYDHSQVASGNPHGSIANDLLMTGFTTAFGFVAGTDTTLGAIDKIEGHAALTTDFNADFLSFSYAIDFLSSSFDLDFRDYWQGVPAYVHPVGDGNLHVSATGINNNGKVLTAGATAGSLSWQVPAVGTVTGVTAVSPLLSSGGTTPVISIPAATNSVNGYASSAHIQAIEANTAKVTNAAHTGEVTGSSALTIASGVVTLAKMAALTVNSIIGRVTNSTGVPEPLTPTNVRSIINVADGANNYVHPTGNGNSHVPASYTADNGKVLTATSSDGVTAWQTLPGAVSSVTASSPILSSGGANPNLSIPAATASVNGYMSIAYASKLDNIAAYANIGVVPNAAITGATKTKIAYDTKGLVTYGSDATQDDIGDGTTNKQYSNTEKTKLAGIASGATNYTHPTGDGNLHVPATGTGNNNKVLTAGATAGSLSWATPSGGGTVTGVTATSPVVSSGGTTPVISIPAATNAINGYATAAHIQAIEANTAKVTNQTHTGEVTGSSALTIASGVVTLSKMANMASGYFLGRNSSGSGIPEALSSATVKTMLGISGGSGGYAGVVNVADYGALNDGSDQTTNIQAAINAASNISNYPFGAIVEFNNGKYGYTSLTIISNDVGLKGKGSGGTKLIKLNTTGNGVSFYGTNSSNGFIYRNSISGISLVQSNNGNASTGYQLSLLYCQASIMNDIRIEKQYFSGTPYYPYQGLKIDSSIDIHMADIFVANCLNNGMVINSCVGIFAINCLLIANGNWQLSADTTNALSLVNFETELGLKGIEIKKTLTPFVVGDNNNRYHYFVNVSSDSITAGHAWQCSDIDAAYFSQCWGDTGATGSYDGFHFTDCINIVMSDIYATANGRHGIYASNACKISLKGGIFNGNGLSTTGDGIHFDGTNGIDSNIIINGIKAESNSGYGVYLNDYVRWFIVMSNMLYGNGSGDATPIRNPTADGTTRIVANNVLHWS